MSNLSDVMTLPLQIPETIPNDWSWRNLVELCNPKQWKTISNSDLTETGYRVFGANGFIGFYHEFNHEDETISVTCRGATCGTVNLIPPRTYITGNSMCLDNLSREVSKFYLFYATQFRTFSDVISGSAQPQITAEGMKKVCLPIPPLPEQKKIASILTSVDEVIENTQKQIDKLQDLKKATMNELLTKGIGHTEFKDSEFGRIPKSWEVVTLEEISEALIDYRGKSPPKSDKGIPLITAKNIRMGFIKMEPKEFIEETSFNQWMVRGIPKFGDIFFTTEAPLGFVAMVPEYKHAVGQRVITISPRREIFDPQFLCYQLQGETFQKQLVDSSTGSTVTGIKQSTLRKILLCVLPLSEQQKIIEMVSSIDIRIDQVSIKLTQTQSLKKSLMQDLLTGKVRVTVN